MVKLAVWTMGDMEGGAKRLLELTEAMPNCVLKVL